MTLLSALILFDDVPGGAGHVKRIAEQDNFMAVLTIPWRSLLNASVVVSGWILVAIIVYVAIPTSTAITS